MRRRQARGRRAIPLFARARALEFGMDCPPLGLDRAGPWEDGFVVNRRISHCAQCKIEKLHASDDSHRTLHRPDADGGRFLLRILFASTLRLCNATQTASPESTDVKTGLVS